MRIGRLSMLRAKILKFKTHITLRDVKNLLSKAEYTEDIGRGVVLSEVTSSEIIGRYFEKNIYIEEIIHPIDGVIEQERFNFLDIAFNIDFEKKLLTIQSNLSKKSNFITFFGACLDFEPTITDIKINPIELVEGMKPILSQVFFRKLTYSNIQIDSTTKASITINSSDDASQKDVFSNILDLHIPSRLTFEGLYQNKRASGTISSSCSMSISSLYSNELIAVIKESLFLLVS